MAKSKNKYKNKLKKTIAYEYDEYIVLFFGDYRKYAPLNNQLGKASHIRTQVINEFAVYDLDGSAHVVYTGDVRDSAVADMYRVPVSLVDTIESSMPIELRRMAIPKSTIWYFGNDGTAEYTNRVKNVNEMCTNEKYQALDYVDWIAYRQGSAHIPIDKYDPVDTFATIPPVITVPPAVPATGTSTTPAIDIYTREQYDHILAEYDKYLIKCPNSPGITPKGADAAFVEWFISDHCTLLRRQLESTAS